MEDSKMLQQLQAVLRMFMALFYLGAGIFLLFFSDTFQIDRALLNIVGGTFLFYGVYRFYRASLSIYKFFFTRDDEE